MVLYIIIAILIFGFLIAIHEFGHFTAAKLLGVKVNEFAIGMGPKLFSRQKGETLFSVRAFPFGGFCAMEGEDEETYDPRAFTSVSRWRRLIILAAGSFMNLLFGFIVFLVLAATATGFGSSTIDHFAPGFPNEGVDGLMAGDAIVSVNGERVYYSDDFSMFLSLNKGDTVDLVIRRDGEKIVLDDFPLVPRVYTEDGETRERYGLTFEVKEPTVGETLKYACYDVMNNVRLIRISLVMLFSGEASLRELTGPVGLVDMMATTSNTVAATYGFGQSMATIFSLGAFIAVNLAVMNMLPIPAVDGGRIFFMLVTALIEKISRKRVNPKYEGYIHSGTLMLLLALMAFVLINDVVKIING